MVSVPRPNNEFIEIRKVIGPGPERVGDGPDGQDTNGNAHHHTPSEGRSVVAEQNEQKGVNGQQIAEPVLNGVEKGKIDEDQGKGHDQVQLVQTPWQSQLSPGQDEAREQNENGDGNFDEANDKEIIPPTRAGMHAQI